MQVCSSRWSLTDTGKAVGEAFLVFVGGVFEESIPADMHTSGMRTDTRKADSWVHIRRGFGSLEKGLLADLALNVHGLLILRGNSMVSDPLQKALQGRP